MSNANSNHSQLLTAGKTQCTGSSGCRPKQPDADPKRMTTPDSAPAFRLFPLMFAALTGTMAMMAFVAVIGPVVRQLGLAEWHAGVSVTAAGVLWMLLARRWGILSDRVGRRPVLLIGLGAYSVVYIAMALFVDAGLRAPPAVWLSASVLILSRALVGAFYAAVPPTAAAIIADNTPPSARTGMMARLGSANALGMVIGPAAAGWIALYGLRWPLYAAAALPLLSLLILAWVLPREQRAERAAARKPTSVKLFDPRLRLPAFAAFSAMVSVSIAQVIVGFFAIDRLGLGIEQGARAAGFALTTVGFALIGAQQLVMRLKTVSPLRWIAIGALVSALGFGSVAFGHSQAMLLLSYGVAAFGMGFVFPAFQALAANAVEAHEQGAAAGTVASAQGMGMIAGPLLGTLLYGLSPVAPYLLVAFTLLPLALAAAAAGGRHE